jgi:hypothetical protein
MLVTAVLCVPYELTNGLLVDGLTTELYIHRLHREKDRRGIQRCENQLRAPLVSFISLPPSAEKLFESEFSENANAIICGLSADSMCGWVLPGAKS